MKSVYQVIKEAREILSNPNSWPGDILSGGWEITSFQTYSQSHKLWVCKAKPPSQTEQLLEWDDGERKLEML